MKTLADIQLKKEEKLRKKLFSSCRLSSMSLVDLKKEMNKLHFVSSEFLIEMMRSFTYYNRKDLFCYFAEIASKDTLSKLAIEISYNYEYLKLLINKYEINSNPNELLNNSVSSYNSVSENYFKSFNYIKRKFKLKYKDCDVKVLLKLNYALCNNDDSEYIKKIHSILKSKKIDISYKEYAVVKKIIAQNNLLLFRIFQRRFNLDLNMKRGLFLNFACKNSSFEIVSYLLKQNEIQEKLSQYDNRALKYLIKNKKNSYNFAVKLIQEKSMIETIKEFVENKEVKDKINQSYMKIDTVKNSTDLKKYLLSLVCVNKVVNF